MNTENVTKIKVKKNLLESAKKNIMLASWRKFENWSYAQKLFEKEKNLFVRFESSFGHKKM